MPTKNCSYLHISQKYILYIACFSSECHSLLYRPNVFLEVKRRPPTTGGDYTPLASFSEIVDPYLRRLQQEGPLFPRTIIYLPVHWCGEMHDRANVRFNLQAATDDIIGPIGQYHAAQSKKVVCSLSPPNIP